MDGLPEESKRLLPSLFAIRDGLYSLEFRRLVQSLTGSGPLSGQQIDLSANAFGHTGHLLCHDDVIGTRKACFCLCFFGGVICRVGLLEATEGNPNTSYGTVSPQLRVLSPAECINRCMAGFGSVLSPGRVEVSMSDQRVGCRHVERGGYPVHVWCPLWRSNTADATYQRSLLLPGSSKNHCPRFPTFYSRRGNAHVRQPSSTTPGTRRLLEYLSPPKFFKCF